MIINPDIEEWFNKLQGRAAGHGGGARGLPVPTGSAALQGIVQPGHGMFGFTAPPISGHYAARAPAPSPSLPSPMGGTPNQISMANPGTPNLGGAAKAAGLEKLGQGATQMIKGLGSTQKRIADARQYDTPLSKLVGGNPGATMPGPQGPLSQQMANNPGATMPNIPAAPQIAGPAPLPPTRPNFSPIGQSSDLPLGALGSGFLGGGVQPVPPIGGGGGLPTLAQGVPSGGQSAEALIRAAAPPRGIDPNTAVAVARSEGLNAYTGDNGSSFGPFQLHYGGVAGGGNAVPGLGDEFTRQTGLNARDPSTVGSQINFALDQAAKGGWGPFHGAARSGIGAQQGIGLTPGSPLPSSAGTGQAAFAAKPPDFTGPNAPAFAGPGSPPPASNPNPREPPTDRPASNDQPGILHGTYNGQDYIYQAPQGGAPAVPLPPAPTPSLDPTAYTANALANALPTWQDIANRAPVIGGRGSTPSSDEAQFRSVTPSDIHHQISSITPQSNQSGGLASSTPQDQAPSGATPHILQQIPDKPPQGTGSGYQPIPTSGNAQFTPISNTQPPPPPVPPPPDQGLGQLQAMGDPGQNQLAAALAGGGMQGPQLDQSAMLAMALSQPPPLPDFSTLGGGMSDFGGGGGMFGGLFG
jgi:hypothetical protein